MSLIDQARDLVRGFVAAEDEYRNSAVSGADDVESTWSTAEVDRIRAEWESQPQHP